MLSPDGNARALYMGDMLRQTLGTAASTGATPVQIRTQK
jgi:hypothetical protein